MSDAYLKVKDNGAQGLALVREETDTSVSELKTQIGEISNSNKNLWTGEPTYTFTGSQSVNFGVTYPAGTYSISAVITSSDTDKTVSRISIAGRSVDLTRGTRASGYFVATSSFDSCTIFASQNTSTSAGDTATWANIQLEVGKTATDYVPHRLTAVDETAREEISKLTKYVSTSGNDGNDGNTIDSAYATLGRALSVGAPYIYIEKGVYNETGLSGELTQYRYRKLKIIGNGAKIVSSTNGLQFRYSEIEVSGLEFDLTNASSESSYAILLLNGTGIFSDCIAYGAKGAGAFRFDGSKVTCYRCIAHDNEIDGFNAHTVNSGYESIGTFVNCVAYNNGDDGLSYHEHGEMYVIGGKYYNNVQAGIAPAAFCTFEIIGAECYENETGIEPVCDNLGGNPPAEGSVQNSILHDNSTYGLSAIRYHVKTLGNGFSGNTLGTVNQGTGATITAYTVM